MLSLFTRPTSSWDVLERIKELVREEPKRINMNFELRLEKNNPPPPRLGYPRCGAVGCVGGWAWHLLQMQPAFINILGNLAATGTRLGLTPEQREELFYPFGPDLRWSDRADTQTREYAERVIKHIKEFQQRYKRQLKDHMCHIGPVRTEDEQ